MATIGLDKLFYSKITEGENGDETYETPAQLAKAMTAELSVWCYTGTKPGGPMNSLYWTHLRSKMLSMSGGGM